MNLKELLELYISNIRRSLAFELLGSGLEELNFINEHLNAYYLVFKRNFSKEETEILKQYLVEYNFKELIGPIAENMIQEAEHFLMDF